ncbi:nitroreductase family deazaflavin-dependent oxidoreductase [Streptomyces sp. HUAS TT20]|uniref:nitroreductase family deazaflavin-dependent oxidoreductase n=1 Tax=Streptomyces sp. HUAS TT20 TaxID=3447509 RepID=UPI0021DA190E|nr:nitroreductase family deazaflavin-dependent oxidoreductase [Streptomyces sp. HUAS 15-9]UXY30240.1 nitroreductase family deazaflavin-dependent oxidoreductase [Streptomyces sp. HUAS 15-9]
MIYLAIAVTAVAVLTLLVLAVVYRVLKSAHSRPTGAAPHQHSRFDRAVLSQVTRAIRLLVRSGVRLGPVMMLTVRGRKSGEPRTNPVDLFERDGRRWLVATHDADAQWVRNLRAAGEGSVSRGRRHYAFTAVELSQDEAAVVLREVLGPRLARPIGGFVLRRTLALPPGATPQAFTAAAAEHPVFELTLRGAGVGEQQERPVARRPVNVPALTIGAGVLVALAHVVLGASGVMTTGQWASGVVVGLLVAGLGNHLRIFGRRS